jgi:pimeloyl-ACP methyl ester carboxylesterase
MTADRAMAYNDVRDAWREYLAKHNNGRGVVLIGHSQGAGILTALLAAEIEGKPEHARLVSALILGSNVAVPRGQNVGGHFRSTPLCERADQTGCVVSYVSFRDTVTPPANSRFGTVQMNNPIPLPPGEMAAACVNPAGLVAGAAEAPLNAYLGSGDSMIVGAAPPPAWATGKTVDTPFVAAPGLLTAQCVSTPTHTYLSVHTNAIPSDPRTDTIAGDVVVSGQVLADWGLHLIDVNLAMGDLVAVVKRQGEAYRARR